MTWQLPLIDVWVWYLMPKEIIPANLGDRRRIIDNQPKNQRDKFATEPRQNRDTSATKPRN